MRLLDFFTGLSFSAVESGFAAEFCIGEEFVWKRSSCACGVSSLAASFFLEQIFCDRTARIAELPPQKYWNPFQRSVLKRGLRECQPRSCSHCARAWREFQKQKKIAGLWAARWVAVVSKIFPDRLALACAAAGRAAMIIWQSTLSYCPYYSTSRAADFT
jgi:hypothetical protein